MRLNDNHFYALKYLVSTAVRNLFLKEPVLFRDCLNIFVNYTAKILPYLYINPVTRSSKRFSDNTLDRHHIGATVIIKTRPIFKYRL